MIFLSVIVPIRNEEQYIEKTLSQLVAQEYPTDRFEILIVDGMSDDSTRKVVAEFQRSHPMFNIRLVDNPGRWSSCARNIGAQLAKGQLVAVIDGHVNIPSRRLFADMEHIHQENDALCLARPAPLVVPGMKKDRGFWIAIARRTWLAHSQSSYIYKDFEGWVDPESSGFAYDRSIFHDVGYFDERFDAAEDAEFHFRIQRAGILAYSSPKFLIYSFPRPGLASLFQQMKRYGIGRARMARLHRASLTLETPVPVIVLLMFLLAPLAPLMAIFQPMLVLIYGSGVAVYIVAVVATGITAASRERRAMKGWLVALGIWLIHLGLGWGFLSTIFRPNVFSADKER